MYNNCGKAARAPSHHENLQRPRVKVGADKTRLAGARRQAGGALRGRAGRTVNNNVETMAKVYILWIL